MPPRSEPPTGSTPGRPQDPAIPEAATGEPTSSRDAAQASEPSRPEPRGGTAGLPQEPADGAGAQARPKPDTGGGVGSSQEATGDAREPSRPEPSTATRRTNRVSTASPSAPTKTAPARSQEPPLWADSTEIHPSRPLTVALVLAALGAVGLAAAGFVPVSPSASPGFASWPWLALLALGPAGAALWLGFTGKPGLGGGLVLGLAALAPGRLVLDLQFAVNGPLTIRPELYLPDRFLGSSAIGAGFWLLVAGHVLTGAAGLLAWRALRSHEEPERRRWRLLVPLLAVVAGAGLLTAPVHSENGFLLARAAFEGPWPALGGYLLLAAALPLAAVVALAAPAETVARGALAGLAAAAFGVAAPPVLAGLFRDDLHVTWGPALVLVAAAIIAGLAGTRLTERSENPEADLAGSAKLPGLFWWRLTTGLLGLATALAALIGAFAPQVAVTALNPGAGTPVSTAAESPARWFLLVAALVLAVPAAGVLVPKTAAVARPVLGVAWAGIVLAGTAVLTTALTATQAGNLAGFGGAATPVFTYDLGAGAAWTFAALVLAALAALAAAGTGVVEREDAGDGTEPDTKALTPVAAGAVLAVAAFGLPVFAVPGYVAPGLWSHLDTPSWGLFTAAVVAVGAAALATRSRPKPAAALLTGAALLTALHAAELPLVGGTLGGASPATGFWVALAATAALLIAAGVAAGRRGRRAP